MAPGENIYFRDYGRYDMAQLRFTKHGNQKLGDNFYFRFDKIWQNLTRAYYFTIEEVKHLFCSNGFEIIENKFTHRMV